MKDNTKQINGQTSISHQIIFVWGLGTLNATNVSM